MSSILPVCLRTNSSNYINSMCELRDIVAGTLPCQTQIVQNETANATVQNATQVVGNLPSFAGRVVSGTLSAALDVAVRVVEYSPVGTIVTGLTLTCGGLVQARRQWNALPGDKDYSSTKLMVYSGVAVVGAGLTVLGVTNVVNASGLFKVAVPGANNSTSDDSINTLSTVSNATNATNATVEAVNSTASGSTIVIIVPAALPATLPAAQVEELVSAPNVSTVADAVNVTAAKVEEVKVAVQEVAQEATDVLKTAKITLEETQVHTELAKEADATVDSLKNLVVEPEVQHAATQEVKTGALKKLTNYAWSFFSSKKEKTA